MSAATNSIEPNNLEPSNLDLQFGEEIEIEESGFSFQPIAGYELEIDGSVYMYSEDGNLEISLLGGALDEDTSIAELNDELAGEFMENFDEFGLIEAGTDTIQNITGFLNEIRFVNAEEEGLGHALICSPYLNQYFFILVISSSEHWQRQGQAVFEAIKSHIRFYPQFKVDEVKVEQDKHPDLTLETYPDIDPDDDFFLNIEKGDVSLLLAARSYDPREQVMITEIHAPDGRMLYHYDLETGVLDSSISDHPFVGASGEVCFVFPRDNRQNLQPGDYRFAFATQSATTLEEIQVIIRSGRALELQSIDMNFWIASEDEIFNDADTLDQFIADIHQALSQRLAPLNLAPGEIKYFHAAPDELETFSTVNIDSDLADCSYMISETVSNGRALNVGLVQKLAQGEPSNMTTLEAVSAGSPGMILTPSSPHACILIAWPAFEGNISSLADALIQQLIIFSGIDTQGTQQQKNQALTLNREIAWRLRRHPLFYDAD
jgi:hypothetical protein